MRDPLANKEERRALFFDRARRIQARLKELRALSPEERKQRFLARSKFLAEKLQQKG